MLHECLFLKSHNNIMFLLPGVTLSVYYLTTDTSKNQKNNVNIYSAFTQKDIYLFTVICKKIQKFPC